MPLHEFWAQHAGFFYLLAGILGLTVGSFLNVVCLRLPVMMERDWRSQCCELLNITDDKSAEPLFNLAFPASHCPQCHHTIRAWENIPLLSYLMLKGKCAGCSVRISPRYPIVEALSCLLSTVVAWHFGFSWACGAALLLTWTLLALAVIDFDTQLLPDDITLPLLWTGLLLSLLGLFTDIQSAVLGAVGGYGVLWSVYHAFKLLTGKEGMGYGDFKLLAALGAWLGWQAIPQIILLSSLVGAASGIAMVLFKGRDKQIPIPFGPYLAAAGWIYLIWGQSITSWYLGASGIH